MQGKGYIVGVSQRKKTGILRSFSSKCGKETKKVTGDRDTDRGKMKKRETGTKRTTGTTRQTETKWQTETNRNRWVDRDRKNQKKTER